jgi:hypothetical protein
VRERLEVAQRLGQSVLEPPALTVSEAICGEP